MTKPIMTVVVVTPQGVKGGPAGQPLQPVPALNEARLQAAVFEDIHFVLLNVLDAKPPLPLQLAPSVEVAGHTLEGVLVRLPTGEWTTLYFDSRSHLLLRVKSPGDGGEDNISEIGDYRDVGGVLFSFKQLTPGTNQSSATVSEIKIDQTLAPGLFE